MKDNAIKYFKSGYSCSEAVVQSAIDKGYAPKELLSVATSFSGGMGVRCLCGAVAGSQMVIGSMYGKNAERDGKKARALAKEFNETFAQKYKVNCCKVLSAGFDFHSPERKQHCSGMVSDCVVILEDIFDTGNSLDFTYKHLLEKKPASLKICTLLDKPERRNPEISLKPDYVGFTVPNEFVVGYGLDFNEFYRNLPYIGVLKPEAYQ